MLADFHTSSEDCEVEGGSAHVPGTCSFGLP